MTMTSISRWCGLVWGLILLVGVAEANSSQSTVKHRPQLRRAAKSPKSSSSSSSSKSCKSGGKKQGSSSKRGSSGKKSSKSSKGKKGCNIFDRPPTMAPVDSPTTAPLTSEPTTNPVDTPTIAPSVDVVEPTLNPTLGLETTAPSTAAPTTTPNSLAPSPDAPVPTIPSETSAPSVVPDTSAPTAATVSPAPTIAPSTSTPTMPTETPAPSLITEAPTVPKDTEAPTVAPVTEAPTMMVATEAPTLPDNVVPLTPFSVIYTLDSTETPSVADLDQASAVTQDYMEDYFATRFGPFLVIENIDIEETGTATDPPRISYDMEITFDADSDFFPTTADLDAELQIALQQPASETLVLLLENLQPDNPFSTATDVTYTTIVANLLRTEESSNGTSIRSSVLTASGMAMLFAAGVGATFLTLQLLERYRSRSQYKDPNHRNRDNTEYSQTSSNISHSVCHNDDDDALSNGSSVGSLSVEPYLSECPLLPERVNSIAESANFQDIFRRPRGGEEDTVADVDLYTPSSLSESIFRR